MNNWCTIESDPAVFGELIEKLGVKDVDVQEIYVLDDIAYLKSLQPVYGFIFLFKYGGENKENQGQVVYDPSLFFARQVITNACATQAMLSVLLNKTDKLELGGVLNNFREFCLPLDSYSRGLAIGESEDIRKLHNSFAKPEPVLIQGSRKAEKDDDVFHFVAYMHKEGCLYELDGLKEGPILLESNVSEEDWIASFVQKLQKRIEHFSEKEIRFNLLALTKSEQSRLVMQVDGCEKEVWMLSQRAKAIGKEEEVKKLVNFELKGGEYKGEFGQMELPQIVDKVNGLVVQRVGFLQRLEDLKAKKEEGRKENERRRHNYIPLIFNLFKMAAEKGELGKLYEEAKMKNSN